MSDSILTKDSIILNTTKVKRNDVIRYDSRDHSWLIEDIMKYGHDFFVNSNEKYTRESCYLGEAGEAAVRFALKDKFGVDIPKSTKMGMVDFERDILYKFKIGEVKTKLRNSNVILGYDETKCSEVSVPWENRNKKFDVLIHVSICSIKDVPKNTSIIDILRDGAVFEIVGYMNNAEFLKKFNHKIIGRTNNKVANVWCADLHPMSNIIDEMDGKICSYR